MSSVESCTLIKNELPAEFNMDRQRLYELKYRIKTCLPVGPISLYLGALQAEPDPLPDIWTPYSVRGDTDDDAYCSKISTKQLEPLLYDAQCFFTTLPHGRVPGEAAPDPMNRPVRYSGAKLVVTKRCDVDKDGKPIVNSAGQEFDDPFEEDISYAVLIAERNVISLNTWVSDMATYINSVNLGAYRTQPERTWWCMDIEISPPINEQGFIYFVERWSLAFNYQKWDEKILDRGWMVKDDEGELEPPKTKSGAGFNEPCLLDGHGKKLAKNAEPIALPFRVKREVNWSTLPV